MWISWNASVSVARRFRRVHCSLPLTPETSYWDWSLDSEDLVASPIWHATNGFGGNGDMAIESGVFHGRCMTEGPFSGLTRQWLSESDGDGFHINHDPHCLSRGFEVEGKKQSLQARVTPDAIQTVLDVTNYEDLLEALEVKAHNSIPQFVRGDFFALTAPNGKPRHLKTPAHYPRIYQMHIKLTNVFQIRCFTCTTSKLTGFGGCGSNKTSRRGYVSITGPMKIYAYIRTPRTAMRLCKIPFILANWRMQRL